MAKTYTVTCSCCGVEEVVNRVTVSRRKRKGETRCFKCILKSRDYKDKLLNGVATAAKAGRRVPHNKGKAVTEEERQRMSERTKRLWENESFRAKVEGHIRVRMGSEEGRQQMRDRWSNPVYRDKVLTSLNSSDVRSKSAVARSRQPRVSSLSLAASSVLTALNIEHILEHPVGPWNFDLFVPSHNLLIECQGEYWHSLPKSKRNDAAKRTYVERYFPQLSLAALKELEFHTEGRVEQRLRVLLGLERVVKEVVFRDLSVSSINYAEAASLYDRHYLKSCRGRIHFGLFLNSSLIGACSFGAFQRNEQALKYTGCVELTRFWIDPEFQVKNLGSWFLSRCLKNVKSGVITYADTSMGHTGALYKACNFKFSHTVPPDYYYVTEEQWVVHKRTVWGRAKKLSISESEYATANRLSKVKGAEKLCFTYRV